MFGSHYYNGFPVIVIRTCDGRQKTRFPPSLLPDLVLITRFSRNRSDRGGNRVEVRKVTLFLLTRFAIRGRLYRANDSVACNPDVCAGAPDARQAALDRVDGLLRAFAQDQVSWTRGGHMPLLSHLYTSRAAHEMQRAHKIRRSCVKGLGWGTPSVHVEQSQVSYLPQRSSGTSRFWPFRWVHALYVFVFLNLSKN